MKLDYDLWLTMGAYNEREVDETICNLEESVDAFIALTEAENEDTWTPEMVKGWDATANKLAIAVDDAYFEDDWEEEQSMLTDMRHKLAEYRMFRLFLTQTRGW